MQVGHFACQFFPSEIEMRKNTMVIMRNTIMAIKKILRMKIVLNEALYIFCKMKTKETFQTEANKTKTFNFNPSLRRNSHHTQLTKNRN